MALQPQGAPRREVFQAQSPQQVQAGAVPGGVVYAPQPARVGDTSMGETLEKLGKWGSDILMGMFDKERARAELDGQIQYSQGKTLQELKDSGADVFTQQGWVTMDALTAVNQFHAAELRRIKDEDAAVDPGVWRASMADRYAGLTEGRNDFQRSIIMESAKRFLPELTAAQITANTEYKRQQTIRSGVQFVASAKPTFDADGQDVGKQLFLAGLQDGPLGRMNPQMREQVLAEGILAGLEQGNTAALDWSQEAGLTQGFSAETQMRLRKAQADYQRRAENEFDEQYTIQRTDMLERLRTGKLSLAEALKQDAAMQESRGWKYDAADANDLVREFRSEQANARAEARAEARADARERRAEDRAAAREAAQREQIELAMNWQLENLSRTDRLQRGEITPEQFMQESLQAADERKLKLTSGMATGIVSDIARAHAEGEKLQAQRAVLDRAVATRTVYSLPESMREAAFDQERQQTAMRWQKKVQEGTLNPDQAIAGMINDSTTFLAETGVVDKGRASKWSAFALGVPLKADGTVSEADTAGFREWVSLYDKNKELALAHIKTPEGKARMLAMADAYQGSGDYAAAIRDGARMFAAPSGQQAPISQELLDDAAKTVADKYSSSKTLSLLKRGEYIRAGAAALDFRDPVSETQAATNAEVIKRGVAQTAQRIMALGVNVPVEAAVEAAAAEVSQKYALIAGALVAHPAGSTVRDKMFTPDSTDEYLRKAGMDIPALSAEAFRGVEDIENDALRLLVQKRGSSLWADYNKISEGAAVTNPVDATLDVTAGPRIIASPHPSGAGLLVRHQRVDDTWSAPAYVSFREMGIVWGQDYMQRKANAAAAEQNRARQAPRPASTTDKILFGG